MILDQFKLNGKVALVTGGSAGLGQAIAIALAEAGADLVCHGNTRSADATCDAVSQNKRQAVAVTGDLSKKETAEALIAATLSVSADWTSWLITQERFDARRPWITQKMTGPQ